MVFNASGCCFSGSLGCLFQPVLQPCGVCLNSGPPIKHICFKLTLVTHPNTSTMAARMVSAAKVSGKAQVAFAPSSLRGTAIRAVPVRATRQTINTVCKASVSDADG